MDSEQLVTTVANRGPVVTELTVSDAKALYEVRGALEGLAGALFAERATAEEWERMGEALHRFSRTHAEVSLAERLAMKDELCRPAARVRPGIALGWAVVGPLISVNRVPSSPSSKCILCRPRRSAHTACLASLEGSSQAVGCLHRR